MCVCVCARACVQVAGVSTNIDFLRRLATHNSFETADVHTGFIPVSFNFSLTLPHKILAIFSLFSSQEHHEALFPPSTVFSGDRLTVATLALLAYETWQSQQTLGGGDSCDLSNSPSFPLFLLPPSLPPLPLHQEEQRHYIYIYY